MAPDGVQIAYASVGTGPPLVKAPNWMNHLEYDWQSPIWRHLLQELAREHTLIRFDQRGNGLSDWDVDEISFDSFVRDLETVVDAAGLEKFALLGISQGCAISIAYAVRHPERVSRLVLYGGSQVEIEQADAMHTLIRHGWGQDNPAFCQMFTSAFVPDGTPRQMDWFNELQRMTTSPENAVRIRKTNDNVNVEELLGQVPGLDVGAQDRQDVEQPRDAIVGEPATRPQVEQELHLVTQRVAEEPLGADSRGRLRQQRGGHGPAGGRRAHREPARGEGGLWPRGRELAVDPPRPRVAQEGDQPAAASTQVGAGAHLRGLDRRS